MSVSSVPILHPRDIGPVNWCGLATLITKEIERFLKAYAQTILAPVISTLLFFSVFTFVLGGNQRGSFLVFLVPGLVMMTMAQNAFMNTSGSLVLSKLQGNIVDILMTPLSSFELTIGYMVGGIARGVMTGAILVACFALFTNLQITNVFFVLYYAIMGSMMFALIGVIGGIWAEKFDHVITVQSFIVLPATFLSGAFYTIDKLPENWRFLCRINPVFYMTDGFRYGFIGVADKTLYIGLAFVLAVNLGLLGAAYCLFESGYKLKA